MDFEKRKKQILQAMETRKMDVEAEPEPRNWSEAKVMVKPKRKSEPMGRSSFDETMRRIKTDFRIKGSQGKQITARPGFKGMSYQNQCRASDILVMEALRRHHQPFRPEGRIDGR